MFIYNSSAVAEGSTSQSGTAEQEKDSINVPKAKEQEIEDVTSIKPTTTIPMTTSTTNGNYLPDSRIETTVRTTKTMSNFSDTNATTNSSPNSASLPYKPTPKMTIHSETDNQDSSHSNPLNFPNTPITYPHYSEDPDIDPKHISDIAEDGMLALRLSEMNGSSPSGQGTPNHETMSSSNRSTSAIVPNPKQLIRIERDYSRGELCQFYTAFPLEIDGRINPLQFQETIATLNELLERAHSPKYNWMDNLLACLTLYTSTFCIRSHYDRMVEEICKFLDNENKTTYNAQGLNFRNPQKTAFLFVSFFN
ncbi:hypothetical protein G9A89_018179 [Geosiphon pyriformis]|nr:hypothetical protein G9A89_018179 [Geosiphon pyriformis]